MYQEDKGLNTVPEEPICLSAASFASYEFAAFGTKCGAGICQVKTGILRRLRPLIGRPGFAIILRNDGKPMSAKDPYTSKKRRAEASVISLHR